MDDNTTKVVMAIIALISAVVTPLVLVIVTKMQNKQIAKNQTETKAEIGVVKEDVKEYRKEVNGHMTKLLQTTGELATANEKVRASVEDKPVQEENKPTTVEGKGIKKDLTQAKEKIDQAKKKLDEI